MKSVIRFFQGLLAIGLLCCTALVHAQERGTREEAKAMAEAAAAHVKKVGHEQAFKDFTQDKVHWTKKDLFVIAFDQHGTCMANGASDKVVGKNLIEMKDQAGKFVTKAVLAAAQGPGGAGWVDYEMVNPLTRKLEPKSTYAIKTAGFDGVVGVGAYR